MKQDELCTILGRSLYGGVIEICAPKVVKLSLSERSHKFSHVAGDHCANEGFCVEHSAADKPTYSHILT